MTSYRLSSGQPVMLTLRCRFSFQVSIVLEILRTIWISHVQSVITVQKEQWTCLTTHVQQEHLTHINIEQMTRRVRVAHQECTAWDLG